ncbi:hypothetical protein [Metabacillus fastidiosus]|uniref:hypothetical protein n=1 Tax=Metabacillus fastidiosus TaxID=1458 RepID=UPI003D2B5B38
MSNLNLADTQELLNQLMSRRLKRKHSKCHDHSHSCHSCDHTDCKGCICSFFHKLSHHETGDLCSIGQPRRFLIKQKGTSTPVSLDGTGTPTEFTFQRFDRKTCCVIFTFEEVVSTSPLTTVTRTFIEDCQQIAGIVCLNTPTTTTGF